MSSDLQEASRLPLAPLMLDGSGLHVEHVRQVARDGRQVAISAQAMERLAQSRRLVLELAGSDEPMYGFNRGVGLNKDREVAPASYESYNRNLLLSHATGVGPYASEEQVRAILLARLNTLLLGCTGIQPDIALLYAGFLNHGIHPDVPLGGSVGAGDITAHSGIGLAFLGEGEVTCLGRRQPARSTLQQAGLTPVVPGPKDGLAIVSSNAAAAGVAALVLDDAARLLELADLVYALSLEALQGSVSPLDPAVHRFRPYEGQQASAARVREMLAGSALWQRGSGGSLQDPLSFRSACHVHGAALDALRYVREALHIQLNASDDNPCVILEERRIVSCANYEPIAWALGLEMLGGALAHVSKSSCYRSIRLGTPAFTGLPRFLSPGEGTIGFCTLQKTITALDAEIRHLSNPASADYFSLAGDMEDHASNAPFIARKTGDIVDRLFTVLAVEAIHAAQAVDLRQGIVLGKGTQALYDAVRSVCAFYGEDRSLSADIAAVGGLLKSHSFAYAPELPVQAGIRRLFSNT